MRRRPLAYLSLSVALVVGGCAGRAAPGPAGAPHPEPRAGSWKTWVVSPAKVRVPPPPTGAAAEAEADELSKLASQPATTVTQSVRRWAKDPITKPWADLNLELVAFGVKDPPRASRAYALTSVAMYDALVATWHWKYVYDRKPPRVRASISPPGPDPSYPSEHAAVAGAASRVLAHLFPDQPAARFDHLAEEAATSRVLAGANYRSDVEAGLELGRAVGEAVVARARTDGADRPWDGKRPPGIGRGPAHWEPPPGTVVPPTAPLAGTWRTWVLASGDQLRPPPPPAYGTPELTAAAREVMDVKAALTPEQERIARFWAGGQGTSLPPGLWIEVAFVYARASHLTAPRAARALALLAVAEADAGVAVWDAKYAYWSPRPVNAIRALGLDAAWVPLLATPPFPSYVSGHAGYSGAASEVLAYLFPDSAKDFRAKAEEAALSRLFSGIHYRFDNDAGLDLGRQVGRLVVDRAETDGSGSPA